MSSQFQDPKTPKMDIIDDEHSSDEEILDEEVLDEQILAEQNFDQEDTIPNPLLESQILKPYVMTAKEEMTFEPLVVKKNLNERSSAETERLFTFREMLIENIKTDNPDYQKISFGSQKYATLLYKVSY